MDKTGIEAIGQVAIEAAAANRLDTDTPAVILRGANGEQAIKTIEHLLPGRSRFRGTFKTAALSAFVAHVLATTEQPTITAAPTFICPDSMAATAFYNLGDAEHAGHADFKAVLQLQATAAYSALRGIVGKTVDQNTLHTFLEDWRDFVSPVYEAGSDSKRLSSALAAVRSVTVETARKVTMNEHDFGQSRSAMESVDAKSDHTLPRGFEFIAVPYEGLPIRTFNLRLGVATANDKIGLVLRLVQSEKVVEDIATDFQRALAVGIGDASPLFVGTFTP